MDTGSNSLWGRLFCIGALQVGNGNYNCYWNLEAN